MKPLAGKTLLRVAPQSLRRACSWSEGVSTLRMFPEHGVRAGPFRSAYINSSPHQEMELGLEFKSPWISNHFPVLFPVVFFWLDWNWWIRSGMAPTLVQWPCQLRGCLLLGRTRQESMDLSGFNDSVAGWGAMGLQERPSGLQPTGAACLASRGLSGTRQKIPRQFGPLSQQPEGIQMFVCSWWNFNENPSVIFYACVIHAEGSREIGRWQYNYKQSSVT